MTPSELTQDKEGNLVYKKGSDKKVDEVHTCNKEGILARITENITSIHGDVTEIKGDVKEVNSQYRELLVEVTKVSGSLENFKVEVRTAVIASDKGFSKVTKIIGIVIAVVMMTIAYFGLTKKVGTTETTIKQEIRQQEGISKVTRSGYVKFNDGGLSDSVKVK